MLYDYIIIGGGISGLYTYYQLLKKDPSLNILLFEKNDYFGGRIKTFYKKINNTNYQLEEGAGRFNKNHILLKKLINETRLKKDIIKIDAKSEFINTKDNFHQKEFINKNAFDYINIVLKRAKNENRNYLRTLSFVEYSSKILTTSQLSFMISSSGYYGRLVKMNAYDAFKVFEKNIRDDIDYYILKNGMESIITKLLEKIKHYSNKLYLNSSIIYVSYDKQINIFNIMINNNKIKNKKYKCKKIIFAIPKASLLSLSYFQKNSYKKIINSIQTEPLCRIYSIFSNIWFNNIIKTTTNNPLQFIIPINKITGLIMISYTDNKNAKFWEKYNNNKILLNKKIIQNIKKVFKKDVDMPFYTKLIYWKDGMNYWKPKKNSSILSKEIIQLDKNVPLYIIGEAYSLNQGWIEGALETSYYLVNKIL
jgi:monoamine oxidase